MTSEWHDIISAISYKSGWEIVLHCNPDGSRPYLQVAVTTEAEASMDSRTGERAAWRGGKVYLSLHMCRQEIIGAAFGAIRAAEGHEMREWFRYRGASIYNPHLDPDVLVEVARRKENFNVRENAMNMVEGKE